MLTLTELGDWIRERHTFDLFRLETLDTYAADSDGDDFRRYLRGEPTPTHPGRAVWLDMLRADTSAANPRRWRKVHVVAGPLTDYERYEFEWGFTATTDAGEEVRVLGTDGPFLRHQVGDFFVVDGEHVIRSVYTRSGAFVGAEPVDPRAAGAFVAVMHLVWDAATPFPAWWAGHPECRRDTVRAA